MILGDFVWKWGRLVVTNAPCLRVPWASRGGPWRPRRVHWRRLGVLWGSIGGPLRAPGRCSAALGCLLGASWEPLSRLWEREGGQREPEGHRREFPRWQKWCFSIGFSSVLGKWQFPDEGAQKEYIRQGSLCICNEILIEIIWISIQCMRRVQKQSAKIWNICTHLFIHSFPSIC